MSTVGQFPVWLRIVTAIASIAALVLAGLAVAGSTLFAFSFFADASPAGLLLACSALACSLRFRAGRLSNIIASVAVVAFGAIVGPDTAAAIGQRMSGPAQANTLKIISANVWSWNPNHQRFIDYIRSEHPDVIVVVEAFGGWKFSLESLLPEYKLVAGCRAPHECDVIILSRLPLAEDSPAAGSSRVLARLTLPSQLGGQSFEVMGLHLSRPAIGANSRQDLDEATELASRLGPLAFVAGDFNATSWAAPLRRFDSNVGLVRQTRWMLTWPTPQAKLGGSFQLPVAVAPIDHIYAGSSWRLADIRRGPDIGSDHYPISASFELAIP